MRIYFESIGITCLLGVLLDLILGDPMWLPHPVQAIGFLISMLDKKLNRKNDSNEIRFRNGVITAALVVAVTILLTSGTLWITFVINRYLGIAAMTIMCWQCIAARSLHKAAMEVYRPLKAGDTEEARRAVSMIVGRDTSVLDMDGITRAAVETVAENTNDGIICPLFYMVIGGPVLSFAYKAVSTMDSMIGYKNDRYLYFGRFAARTDDVLAYIPARMSAALMIVAANVAELFDRDHYSASEGIRIFTRDRFNHASPNSAQCESVCAGVLGLRLAGPAVYFGRKYDKKYIGDARRSIEPEDIKRACFLMYGTEVCFILLLVICIVITILTGII